MAKSSLSKSTHPLANRFIGYITDEPFLGPKRYAFDGDVTPDPSFVYEDGSEKHGSGWTKMGVIDMIQRGKWTFLSPKTIIKYFPKHPAVVAFLNPPPVTKTIKSKSMFVISKAKLYFNLTTKQVERVLTVQDGALVWTSRHKQEAKPYSKSTFRLASADEVKNYLAEAQSVGN